MFLHILFDKGYDTVRERFFIEYFSKFAREMFLYFIQNISVILKFICKYVTIFNTI